MIDVAQIHIKKHPNGSDQGTKFTIQLHGWAVSARANSSYVAHQPISIKYVWKNESKKEATILLSDHHSYHGTLGYPVGMAARVFDSGGRVPT